MIPVRGGVAPGYTGEPFGALARSGRSSLLQHHAVWTQTGPATEQQQRRSKMSTTDDALQPEADMICAAAAPEAFRSEGRVADLR